MKMYCRTVSPDDAEIMTLHRNKNRHCFFTDEEVTVEGTREWIRSLLRKEDDATFIVCNEDSSPIALFGIYDIKIGKSAELGRILKFNGDTPLCLRKVCSEKLDLIAEICNLKDYLGRVKIDNLKSLYFMESLGFVITSLVTSDKGFLYYEMHNKLTRKE
jgi:RimJ/RimL family protein N-acetyltransferase